MINDRNYIARYDVLDFYRFAGAVIVAIVHYTVLYLPVVSTVRQYVTYQLQPLMGFFSAYRVSLSCMCMRGAWRRSQNTAII